MQIAGGAPRMRALLLLGTVLGGLSGCRAERDSDAGREPRHEVAGQVASALTTNVFDLIQNANSAYWHNAAGGVPWGTGDNRGACFKESGLMENGQGYPYLFTHPQLVPDGFMHGQYSVTVPAASQHPTLTTTFGFKQGAAGTGGALFSVTTFVNNQWVTLVSQVKTYNGALTTKTANLSAYAGQTIPLYLNIDAWGNSNWDWGAWTDARVYADSTAGCTIGGVQYATDAINPAAACQTCDPLVSTTAWTTKPDTCSVNGQCYAANDQDVLGCRRCDPTVSQTSFTNKAGCDNLIVGVTTSTDNGDFGGSWQTPESTGMLNADAWCANEGNALGLPGVWKAVLSKTGFRDLRDAVPSAIWDKQVVNLAGQQLYTRWDSIFSNQVWNAGISIYAFGTSTTPAGSAYSGQLWSGSGLDGKWLASSSGNNCDAWSDIWKILGITPNKGIIGDASARKLLNNGEATCTTSRRLACVLVPPEGPLTIENYDGTPLGAIKGKSQGNSIAYLGVPYAAPPTGSLRLAPPAKATAWSGIRSTTAYPAACAQPPLLPTGGMIGSEDCLYLNVWMPKTATASSNLPVMVFHHGGGFLFGGAASTSDWLGVGFYDGDKLASAQNAVVVTLQSRLGPLGYLADPALSGDATSRTSTTGGGTSGNYGLLDVIQALKWVKRNIAKFGGDPTHVMFFGQSSGATTGYLLLASPLARDPADGNKPYFSSMTLESGFPDEPPMSYRYTQGAATIQKVGCDTAADKVACLRGLSTQAFVTAEGAILEFFPSIFNAPTPPEVMWGLTFGPGVDGYVIPTGGARLAYAAGTHNKVPIIAGNTKDENNFSMLLMLGGILTGDLTDFVIIPFCANREIRATTNLGAALEFQAQLVYPCDSFSYLGPTLSYAEAATHVQYICPTRRSLRALKAGQTQPVRRYHFVHAGDHIGVFQNVLGLIPAVGAAHTFEVPYIFNTHGSMLGYLPSLKERALGTAMQKYWRTLAATGDPNYSGGTNWAAYDGTTDNTLVLEVPGKVSTNDPGIQMVNGIETTKCDFWDNNFTMDGYK